jgi:hypothetical protein
MSNLIDITTANLDDLLGEITLDAADVAEALNNAGIAAKVVWAYGDDGRVDAAGITIIVQNGTASVAKASKSKVGHGAGRLASHALYPAPVANASVEAIEAVIATL